MPSLVPAGYTRGPIFFVGAITQATAESTLLQRIWNEAGAYGSRLAVIGVGAEGQEAATRATAIFGAWESEFVEQLVLQNRADALALDEARLERLAQATGVLLVGERALQMAGVLGGTPLAQTLRRMNARSKVVGALGGGAAILCQHMAIPTAGDALPLVHRDQLLFAPGLGLVNRLVVDLARSDGAPPSPARLLTAVAYNPFLVAVGLESNTGVVVYPNTMLEVFGERSALLVDGAQVGHADVGAPHAGEAASLLGVAAHVLGAGCTYNLDTHTAQMPAATEAPLRESVSKSAY